MSRSLLGALALSICLIAGAAKAAPTPFSSEILINTSAAPEEVVAGDLDGDGDLDVVSNAGTEIVWFENLGGGSFGAKQTIATGVLTANAVTVGDLDGDGDIDVVGGGNTAVYFYENDGLSPPSFTTRTVAPNAGTIYALEISDLDHDGHQDVVVAHLVNDLVVWHENDGASPPVFTAHTVASGVDGPIGVAVGDIDLDGDRDLAVAYNGADLVVWYESDGASPPVWTPHTIAAAAGAAAVRIADLNIGGRPDVAARRIGQLLWYINGAGAPPTWTAYAASADGGVATLAAEDIDADGDTDLVSAEFLVLGADRVAWYENNGADPPVFSRRTVSTSLDFARYVNVGDLDGDGDLDLLSTAFTGNELAWYRNETIHGRASFTRDTSLGHAGFSSHLDLTTVDVDGDGDLDILSANQGDGTVWRENTGGVGSFTERPISTGDDFAVPADFDRDGDIDVVSAFSSSSIRWYESDGASPPVWQTHYSDFSNSRSDLRDGAAADVDADGDVDLVVVGDTGVAWHENDGAASPIFTERVIATRGFVSYAEVEVGDLDRDGDADVVLASNGAQDEVVWYENDGASPPAWTPRTVQSGTPSNQVALADVDGDGDLDIVSAHRGPDALRWHENDGISPPGWTTRNLSVAASFDAAAVELGDFDRDGDLDIVAALDDSLDDRLVWYESDGAAPPSWTEHVPEPSSDLWYLGTGLAVGDIDGDGLLDLVHQNDYSLYRRWNGFGQFSLETTETGPVLLMENTRDDFLRIDLQHEGWVGEPEIELATVELRLRDETFTDWTQSGLESHIDEIAIHLDDGSGVFEPGSDASVLAVTSFPLVAGVLTLTIPDADANFRVTPGQTRSYFVALEAGPWVSPTGVRVTHLTQSSSTGEDFTSDDVLKLAYQPDTGALQLVVVASATSDLDGDGLLDIHETNTGVFVGPTDTGSNPNRVDTDFDGLDDADELAAGTDPNDGDSDDDLLSDSAEINTYGTDPNDPDSDDDGDLDWTEIQNGSDPNDGSYVLKPLASSLGAIRHVTAGDADNDTDVDVFAGLVGPKVHWLRSSSLSGNVFTPELIVDLTPGYGASTVSLQLASLDVAGSLELAIGSTSGADYAQRSGPGLWSVGSACGEAAAWTRAADYDGDGDVDLAQVYAVTLIPLVLGAGWCENPLYNPPPSGLWEFYSYATGLTLDPGFPSTLDLALELGHLDGDGVPDLVVASGTEVTAYPSASSPIVVESSATAAVAVAVADLNGDTDADIVVADRDAGTISWYPGPDFTSSSAIDSGATAVSSVAVADFDQDGHVDVAASLAGLDKVVLYQNDGAAVSWTPKTLDIKATDAAHVHFVDVDLDTDVDLLAAVPGLNGGEVRLYNNQLFDPPAVPGLSPGALGMLAAVLSALGAAASRRLRPEGWRGRHDGET